MLASKDMILRDEKPDKNTHLSGRYAASVRRRKEGLWAELRVLSRSRFELALMHRSLDNQVTKCCVQL